MGFYYFSILSIVPLVIAYALLALIYWGLVRATRGRHGRAIFLTVAGLLFLLLPISEELWIAWNFGQACKEAGTFIQRKVQVEGFYDDTTHWWRQLKESSNYQFVESRDNSNGTLWRVERDGDNVKHFRIDRPTARYHYRDATPLSGAPWAHKVRKRESVVIDAETGEVIARNSVYGRDPPWFFFAFLRDVPTFACDGPGRWPYPRSNPLVYRDALIPTGQR